MNPMRFGQPGSFGTGFGAPPSNNSGFTASSGFGQTGAPTVNNTSFGASTSSFGQTNIPAGSTTGFGAASSFGQPRTGGFAPSTGANSFGAGGFPTAGSTTPFSGAGGGNSTFGGSSTAPTVFGARGGFSSTSANFGGAATSSSAFGNATSTFGNNSRTSSGLGASANASSTFGSGSAPFGAFSGAQPTLFGPPNSSLGPRPILSFSGSGATTLGTAATQAGASNQTLNPFAASFQPKASAGRFGAPSSSSTQTTFGAPHAGKKPQLEPSTELFAKLPSHSTLQESDLYDYFSRFGPVTTLQLKANGKCFVTMANVSDAQKIVLHPKHEHGLYVTYNRFAAGPSGAGSAASGTSSMDAMDGGDGDDGMDIPNPAATSTTTTSLSSTIAPSRRKEKPREEKDEKEELEKRIAILTAKKAAARNQEISNPLVSSAVVMPGSPERLPVGGALVPPLQATSRAAASSSVASTSNTTNVSRSRAASPEHMMDTSFPVGRVTLMSPPSETQMRMEGNTIELLETPHRELPHLASEVEKLAIMKFKRPAAGEKLNDPDNLRTEEALDRTAEYLWQNILDLDANGLDPRYRDANQVGPSLMTIITFVIDRVKRISQEFTMQGYSHEHGPFTLRAARILEECTRCFILASQELFQVDDIIWSHRTNNEALNSCIKTLFEVYKKAEQARGKTFQSPNEPEMQAFYVVMQLDSKEESSNLIVDEIYQKYRRFPVVALAKQCHQAFYCGDHFAFFKIFRNAPYLIGCLMRRGLDRMRRIGLRHLNGSAKVRTTVPLTLLAEWFCFDSVEDVATFCTHGKCQVNIHESTIVLTGDDSVYLEHSAPLKLGCRVLEDKRGKNPRKAIVGDVLRGWASTEDAKSLQGPLMAAADPTASPTLQETLFIPAQPDPEQIKLQEAERLKKEQERLAKEAALELERLKRKQEEEASALAAAAEAERIRNAQEELIRDQMKKQEEQELQRRLLEQKRKAERGVQQQKQLTRVFGVIMPSALKRACVKQWCNTAKRLSAELKSKGKQVHETILSITKRRAFARLRRVGRLRMAGLAVLNVFDRLDLHEAWNRFKNEFGNDLNHREKRFRQEILSRLDAFPSIRPAASLQSSKSIRRPTTLDVSLNALNLPSIDELREWWMERKRTSTAAPYWKLVVVYDERDVPSDPSLRLLLQAFQRVAGTAVSPSIFVENLTVVVSFVALLEPEKSSAVRGADSIVYIQSASGQTFGLQEKDSIQQFESLAKVTGFISPQPLPVVFIHLPEGNKHHALISAFPEDETHLHVDVTEVRTGLKWALDATIQRIQPDRPIVREVLFDHWLLLHFPRLKWGSFDSPVQWIKQGCKSLEESAFKLKKTSLQLEWPPSEATILNLLSSRGGRRGSVEDQDVDENEHSKTIVDLEWNSPDRVEQQSQQILRCARTLQETVHKSNLYGKFENFAQVAVDFNLDSIWIDYLMEASRGDGMWFWEHVLVHILRSLVSSEWVVYDVAPPSDILSTRTTLVTCLREPPHVPGSSGKPKKQTSPRASMSSVRKLKRSRDFVYTDKAADDLFEQKLSRLLSTSENVEPPPQQEQSSETGRPDHLTAIKAQRLTRETAFFESLRSFVLPSRQASQHDLTLVEKARLERLKQEDLMARMEVVSRLGYEPSL